MRQVGCGDPAALKAELAAEGLSPGGSGRDALRQPAPGPPAGPGAPPETWAPLAPGQDWQQVPVAVEERGFRLIYGLLHKSLPEARCRLERARRVQSPFLWDKYKRKQSHMSRQTSPEQRLRNERHLFHGTSAGAVPAFCKHNLDPRLPGEHAALYGQGSYFARRASYSHRYAPPAEAGLRHGSLCKIYVVFDGDPCYPYFLLQYRQLEEVVKVG
ncbi:unnamed protein product [Caretta caretta]